MYYSSLIYVVVAFLEVSGNIEAIHKCLLAF